MAAPFSNPKQYYAVQEAQRVPAIKVQIARIRTQATGERTVD